jgi:hypothetical protein
VEGDFDATALKLSRSAGAFGGGTFTDPLTGTLDARLGYAFDRALIYGKGGGAFMQEKYNLLPLTAAPPLAPSTAGAGTSASASNMRYGAI